MTYSETVQWLFNRLPVYQKKGANALNYKLDGISNFLDYLKNPQKNLKSIHIAGTNGKGSSSSMLASILQENGYQVGLYTSPHLIDFRERIKINGHFVSQSFVIDFVAKHQIYIEQNQLSFFELTVAMCFNFFADKKVDLAVIETGLGGRLDSTNVISPEVSLITNIGFDHVEILGDTLEKIASEKAGIIKPNTPIIISEYQKEVAHIFENIAQEKSAPIVFASNKNYPNYKLDLLGKYQQKNLKGVLATLEYLKKFPTSQKAIQCGLANVSKNINLQGRWQIIKKKPLVIADTAHNESGLHNILSELLEISKPEKIHFILGFVKDKNLDKILPLFPKESIYYFCKPLIFRGIDSQVLKNTATKFQLQSKVFGTVKEAYQNAIENTAKDKTIYIGGSSFVVADFLTFST